MGTRLPNVGIVAVFALLVGGVLGAGTAALDAAARPWRIGDFAPEAIDAPPGPSPRAEVPESVHRFGTIGVGGTGEHEFVIANSGPAPLTLSQGATSCSCTVSDFEPGADGSPAAMKTVPPGKTTKVKVQWRGKGDGPYRQQATILTNDPRRPEIALVVEGTVIPTWKAVPSAIVLPALSRDGGERATARVYTYGKEPPLVESLSTPDPQASPFLHFSSSPLAADDIAGEAGATGGFLLTVEVKPGLPRGPLRDTVRMVFRMPEKVTAELPLEAAVTGDLALAGTAWDSSHRAVSLGTVSGRSGLRTDLFLTARGPHRASLRPVVSEVVPKSLVVEVGEGRPIGAGGVLRFPLTITIPPGSPSCNHLCSQQARGGRIVIETGHPDEPTLTIPVCVAIGP